MRFGYVEREPGEKTNSALTHPLNVKLIFNLLLNL